MYYIYQIIDHNGIPIYIGKTNNIKRRIQEHKLCMNSNVKRSKYYLYRKLKKLSCEHNYKLAYAILESDLLSNVACEREIYWINKLKSLGIKLCNLTNGGEGTPGHKPNFTDEWRKNLGAAARRRQLSNPSFKGKKHSHYTKELMSKAHKDKFVGKDNPFYGHSHTKETKKLLSQQRKDKGLKYYIVISPNKVEYYVTEGLHSFCRRADIQKYNLHPCGFSHVLVGRYKTYKGWLARYTN